MGEQPDSHSRAESSAVRAVHGSARAMQTSMSWWRWTVLMVAHCIGRRAPAKPPMAAAGAPAPRVPTPIPAPMPLAPWRSRGAAGPAS